MNSGADGSSLGEEFYANDCTTLARALLGQTLVREVDGVRVSGRIVEVESYLGGEDAASHSKNGKRTPRNEPMFMAPGTAYVYSIYGMYYCFNISSQGAGAAVLLRALEPLEGQEQMRERRLAGRKRTKLPPKASTRSTADNHPSAASHSSSLSSNSQPSSVISQPSSANSRVSSSNSHPSSSNTQRSLSNSHPSSSNSQPSSANHRLPLDNEATSANSKLKSHQLCNGPSKLCSALAINKESCNKVDLPSSRVLFLEGGAVVPPERVVCCKRIGIDACGPEWTNKPLRFYELGSKSVSVRDKRAEEGLLSRWAAVGQQTAQALRAGLQEC